MRLIACCLFLVACGSSKSSQKELTEDDLRNAKQDDSWTSTTFDSPHCNHFIAKMTQCRQGAPDEAKGALDLGMKETIRALRENADGRDMGELCTQFVERAPQHLGDVCPSVEWGAP